MKTLAQFKRDIKVGDIIEITEIKEATQIFNDQTGETTYSELMPIEIGQKIQGPRKVTKIDTTGFYLSKDDMRGSFCEFPKASELAYQNDDTFTIIEVDRKGITWQARTYKIMSETLEKYKGKQFSIIWPNQTMKVNVTAMDVKMAWNNVLVMVEPTCGEGFIWVNEHSLKAYIN